MDINLIGEMISVLSADAGSIRTLVTELCESVEHDSCDYYKLHAIYTIAESQNRLLDELDELVVGTISEWPHTREQ